MFAAGWVLALRAARRPLRAVCSSAPPLIAVAVIRLLHHLPRLRPRLVLPVAPAQRPRRDVASACSCSLRSGTGTTPTSCTTRRRRTSTAAVRRRVDDDGRGVPRGVAVRGAGTTGSTTRPWVMFTVGPVIKFAVLQRMVALPDTTPRRITRSVYVTNVGIAVFVALMVVLVGPAALPGRAAAHPRDRRLGCDLAVLRAALLRGRVLVSPRAMALRRCGDAGQFAPAPRPGVAVRLRATSGSTTSTIWTPASRTTTFRAAPGSIPSCRPSTASRCARASPPAT